MQVSFYGHVRQYRNIQSEIDANMKRVLESGEYVHGPMLKQFEQELAAFHGMTHAIGTDAIGMDYEHDMPPYVEETADWLDDDGKPHPLRFERAFHGLEIM